jgi:hypothetical protein
MSVLLRLSQFAVILLNQLLHGRQAAALVTLLVLPEMQLTYK